MKHTILFLAFSFFALAKTGAQNTEFHDTMKEVVDSIYSASFVKDLTPYANQMERIADAEKGEWLPRYWAAFCYLIKSYTEPSNDKKDLILDKADKLLASADSLNKSNDEIAVLRANLASARIGVDPMNRWQKYGALSAEAIATAKAINPDNPRIYLHEAQGVFYTPEAYGGGKEKALPLINTAIEYFQKFKPTSDIMPNWGLETANYMKAEAEK